MIINESTINDQRIQDLIKESIEICKELGYDYDYTKIKFVESDKYNALGTCQVGKDIITLSKNILDDTDEVLKRTILHELGHWIAWEICIDRGYIYKNESGKYRFDENKIRNSPYYAKDLTGHGALWKRIVGDINNKTHLGISRLTHSDTFSKAKEDKQRYKVTCQNCGNSFGYMRATDFTSSPNAKSWYGNGYRWTCGRCHEGGQFIVKDTKTGKEWS